MKKTMVLVMALLMVGSVLFAGVAAASTLDIVGDGEKSTEFTTGRDTEDYVKALIELAGADEAGDIYYPEENEYRYLFVPLHKDGELIGYGSWINTVIYQHAEDMIAVVAPDGSIMKWKPIDANDHHPELRQEKYLSRYYGMTLESTFDPAVDVISGSTYSSNTFFFELRNILLTFEIYGPNSGE